MSARTPTIVGASACLQACLADADPALGGAPEAGLSAAAQARDLSQAAGCATDHARASAWHCVHLLRLGRHAQALREAGAVLPLLAAPALAAERREVLRVATLAGSELGAFDEALDAAHELVRLTAPLGEHGPALTAAFALAACFERMGDSWQAVQVLSRALSNHGGGSPDLPLLVATNGLCAISIGIMHRLLGTGADDEVQAVLQRARAAGEQARAMLGRLPDPVYEVAVLGNLGEVMLHQGEADAGEPLLRQAQALAEQRGMKTHGWRVRASLGEGLIKRGEPAQALAAMQLLLAEMGGDAPPQTAIRSHQAAYRACRALGRFAQALDHFETAERMERRRTIAQLRAQSELFVTRTEAQRAHSLAEQARLDAQAQRERAAEFAASAERDPLTGLGNRRHLERRCSELLPQAQREGWPLTLVQIDIDHFKLVNDRHGHAVGDRVLVVLAGLLRENLRATDVVTRHGGEEFVVVLPGLASAGAAEFCERLRLRVAHHPWHELAGSALQVTVSLGLASAPPYDAGELLHGADLALYRAKRGGRNQLCLAAA